MAGEGKIATRHRFIEGEKGRGRGKGQMEGEGKIATRCRFVASTKDTSV